MTRKLGGASAEATLADGLDNGTVSASASANAETLRGALTCEEKSTVIRLTDASFASFVQAQFPTLAAARHCNVTDASHLRHCGVTMSGRGSVGSFYKVTSQDLADLGSRTGSALADAIGMQLARPAGRRGPKVRQFPGIRLAIVVFPEGDCPVRVVVLNVMPP
jgi:hypothetical protein